MNHFRILVIDDDRLMRSSLVDLFEAVGWTVKALARATDAHRWITQFQPDAILSDVRMPEMSGLDLLRTLEAAPPVVLISAHGDIPMAVEAMNQGAYSFVEKPYDPKRLISILSHAADQHQMRESNQRLKDRLQQLSGLDQVILGQTPEMVRLRDMIAMLAGNDAAVLLHGETGTGKELVARALHDISARCDGPYIAVNAAQLHADQLPLVARSANGGTLFLDEICACPLELQPMLLRLIDTKEVLDPEQGTPEKVNIRVVSATNVDTDAAMKDGRLRADLLFRLDGVGLHLPPLRTRLDDIALLILRFMQQFALQLGCDAPELSDTDLASLLAHDWPGNVRELRNVGQRRVMMAQHGFGAMPDAIAGVSIDTLERSGLRAAVAAFERQMIGRAIATYEGRMDEVAAALEIGRRTLNEKIVKLGLDKDALL
ncbi:MAG TPA: sigma-54-dependent Fis family transcriptional regulator [Octadecabacter sp.]|nr:sigma-54-dependent Fis family transcriptional regulator [Octadecabacter sp.]